MVYYLVYVFVIFIKRVSFLEMKKIFFLCFICLITTACHSLRHPNRLIVTFSEPTRWNGKVIPGNQICEKDLGNAKTPGLVVRRIPKEANMIIVEFNDVSTLELSYDGGLGKVGYYHDGSSTAWLMPVPAETNKLPDFAFKEASHRVAGEKKTAYFPPCGKKNHMYAAEVKAVRRTGKMGEQTTEVLAYGMIKLGRY